MNPFRQLLMASGKQPPLGTWVMSASPLVAEAVGVAGFDWCVLDMEHSPLSEPGIVPMLHAVATTRMVPVVRVPWNDPVVVKRVLDAGAQTLLFPQIQNADDARRAVAATRYPPEGVRGLANVCRASRFGTVPDFALQANRSVGVIVELETPAAIAELEAIAAVPGVDALFVGPADLCCALGRGVDFGHADVVTLMEAAARRAKAAGKPIGTVGATAEVVTRYRGMGHDFLAVASDLGLLVRASQQALRSLRGRGEGELVHTLATGTAAT